MGDTARPQTKEYANRVTSNPANRAYCDFCTGCTVYGCDGSTARHHFIHVNPDSYFFPNKSYGSPEAYQQALRDWLQTRTGWSEYSDRNSGV